MLVTGGAGFIGSNLVHRLLDLGFAVTALDDLSTGLASNLSRRANLTFAHADVGDADAVAQAIRGCSAVFHLAASVGNQRSLDDPVRDAGVNVLGTLRVLEAAREAEVRKVVLSSSAGIFGELKTTPIREDHPVEPDSPYGCTKLCAEKLALAYGRLYGIDVICLRYFNVYGPRQRFDPYGNVIPKFVFQALRGETLAVYGDGEQTRDFVNVADVVAANIAAANASGVSGAYNIGSGSCLSVNALLAILRDTCGLSFSIVHGPPRPGDVRDSLADISAAQRAFGYVPRVPIHEGLLEYATWARRDSGSGRRRPAARGT